MTIEYAGRPERDEAGFCIGAGMQVAGLNVSELLELGGVLVVVGALAGFLAGVFGIGGGAILVPVVYECFRLVGVALEGLLARAHGDAGDMGVLRVWAGPVVSGVILGSVIARYAPERLFKYVFVAVAWSAAVRLLFGRDSWRVGGTAPGGFLVGG